MWKITAILCGTGCITINRTKNTHFALQGGCFVLFTATIILQIFMPATPNGMWRLLCYKLFISLHSRVAEWHHALSSTGGDSKIFKLAVKILRQEGAKPPMKESLNTKEKSLNHF